MVDWRKFWRWLGVALRLRDPPNLPTYGWSYFDHLVAVYLTLNTADPRADAVIKKSRERPDDLTWGDIFLLEDTNFFLMPPNLVDRSAWILRERFREIAGSTVYDKYLNSNFPKDTDTPAKASLLKADLTRVLDVLHWYYSLIPVRERIRTSLTVRCIIHVVAYTVLLGLFLTWCNWHSYNFLAMLSCVLFFGIIGGFVSSQRRMQSLPNDGDPIISVFGLDSAGYYLFLSPLLGAIFAVILTLMFIAGILKGSIFPDFYFSPASAVKGLSASSVEVVKGLPFFHLTWYTLPKSSEEYGKLFVWAFLAGFAERLVPDSLDRLASKLDLQTSSSKNSEGTSGATAGNQDTEQSSELKPKVAAATLQDALHTGEVPPKQNEGN
jgi:hypothetical protein